MPRKRNRRRRRPDKPIIPGTGSIPSRALGDPPSLFPTLDAQHDAESLSGFFGRVGAIPAAILVVVEGIFATIAIASGWSALLWVPGVVAAGLAILAVLFLRIGPDRGYKFGVIAFVWGIQLALAIQFILCVFAGVKAVWSAL